MSQPVYLLVGDQFLAEETLDKIRAEAQTDPMSEVFLDAGAGPSDILNAADTLTLFGGKRLVVIHDVQSLTKAAREALDRYLAKPSEGSVVVLIASGRTNLAKSVEAVGAVINLELPRGRGLVTWLRERARERGLKLDDRGARALIESVGNELRDLHTALEQLATGLGPGGVVGPEDVYRAFPRFADERVYALTDAVGERKISVAMITLRRLLEQEDAPLVVFGALTAHIRRLIVARAYADKGARAVGDALGFPPWRAKKIYEQAKGFRQEELNEAMQILAETDVEMKGGDLSPEAALERAVLRIVAGDSLRAGAG
jgi:DNA polymerase III subunit delta